MGSITQSSGVVASVWNPVGYDRLQSQWFSVTTLCYNTFTSNAINTQVRQTTISNLQHYDTEAGLILRRSAGSMLERGHLQWSMWDS